MLGKEGIRPAPMIGETASRTGPLLLFAQDRAQPEKRPEEFGKGILTLIRDRNRAQTLGDGARRLAEEEYSYENYVEKTRRVLDFLSETAQPKQAVPSQAPSK